MEYFNRATEKLIIDDKQGAINDLSISVSIDSSNTNTLSLLSETMIEIKDYENAIRCLEKITLKDPQNARAYFLKGTSELAIKQNNKACIDLRKAGELGYYDAYELITINCVKKEKNKSKR
jgi:tetratricopeptide (TPR) repeat protein